MDLTKEITEIMLDKKNPSNVVSDLVNEQEQLRKKIHIVKVLGVATELENHIKEGFFQKYGICFIHLIYARNYDGDGYALCVDICDSRHKIIEKNRAKDAKRYAEVFKLIYNIFEPVSKLYKELVNSEFNEMEMSSIQLRHGISEDILTLMLAEDLKKALDYNKMNVLMPQKDNSTVKRPKI